MPIKKLLANWGNYPQVEATVYEPEFADELSQITASSDRLLARGNGRCYGDSALNNNLVSTLQLNKFLDFDGKTGEIEVQAGVLLSDIIEFALPKGFFIPVTPGTKFITVGGAVATDIHGKNHHSEGCFSDHTISFKLVIGDGSVVECSRNNNSELFWSTVGGMGLTGIILSIRFKLKAVESAYIKMESIKCKDLDAAMKLYEESESWTYTVSWIDCLQKGKNLGRSILMRGEHALLSELPAGKRDNPLHIKPKLKLNVPIYFPNFALNTFTVKAFNFLYWNKQQAQIKKVITTYDTFYYPLDSIHNWNRIYGKRGFIQYQFVLPKETSREGLQQILSTIAGSGQGSFLAVLKLFGKNNPLAYNSFPMEGYTLALDFKINDGLPALVARLDDIVQKYKGRLYLAKDSMSRRENFVFDTGINAHNKFHSAQNDRLFSKVV